MIIVHIGMPKAGSTTIQRFLQDNDQALRGHSIDYPEVGRENLNHRLNHRNLANEILGRNKRIHHKSGALSDLAAHLRTTSYATTILSSEELCRCRDASIAELHGFLARFDREVRIILIIRDLIDLIPSAYAQSIRYGANASDFDAFVDRRESNAILDQFNVAERWAKVFGWQAIRVRLLDPSALLRGDLIADFMASAGVHLTAEEVDGLSRPPRANESAGWMTLEAVRGLVCGRSGLDASHPLVRMDLPPTPRARKIFGQAAEDAGAEIGWTREKGRYLTAEQAQSLLGTFTLNVTELNRRLNEQLPRPFSLAERGFLAREFLPDVSRIKGAELRGFYDAWARRIDEQREGRRRKRRKAAASS